MNLIQFEGRTVAVIAPEDLEALEAENARIRDVLRTYNITVPETQPKRGPQPCSHCGGNGWEP